MGTKCSQCNVAKKFQEINILFLWSVIMERRRAIQNLLGTIYLIFLYTAVYIRLDNTHRAQYYAILININLMKGGICYEEANGYFVVRCNFFHRRNT